MAALGTQTLIGHAGADIFRFHGGRTEAFITDFQVGADKLQFEGDDQPQYAIEGGNTVITFGETSIVLFDVALSRDQSVLLI